MNKISIIIPCYNAEEYIHKCLDSIANQTYGIDNLEVICINDASTDSTFDILCQYEQKYPESFLIINNEVNTKQGYARNIGIRYSSSEYIMFVDSDDYVDSTIVEKLYNKMTSTNHEYDYDYVACRFYRVSGNELYNVDDIGRDDNDISDNTQTIEYVIDTEKKRKDFIMDEGSTLGCWATLYRKSFITDNNIYFAEGIVYEDLLWLGMVRFYANHACILPDRLYYYVNYNNTSIVAKNNSPHHFDRLKAMLMYLDECKKRGLYDLYKDEIDMNFIWIYYVNSLILFARRMSYVPANILNEMIDTVKSLMPDYKNNPHIKACEGISVTILSLIDVNPTTQAAWNEIMDILREI